jgi:hypothetical protein
MEESIAIAEQYRQAKSTTGSRTFGLLRDHKLARQETSFGYAFRRHAA